ncbi:MAG: hypothetical protein MJZ45_00480 [Bacteroidales bacterium]|nr:hypothetical protein [Bacteroidales bacterium]
MSIELLAKQGRDRIYGGLASIETDKLRQIRDAQLRSCFARMDETRRRMELVARIHGIDFLNDAAARSVNATWYTLQRTEGSIIWIAFGGDDAADYARLRSLVLMKVRMLICVGSDNEALHKAFNGCVQIVDAESIGSAVHKACYSGYDGAKVILSPATREGLSDESASDIFCHEVNEL